MTTSKDAATLLLKNWHTLTKELSKIDADALDLEKRKQEIISQLDALLKTLDVLKQRPADLDIPLALLYRPGSTISEVIVELLFKYGAMTRKELADILPKTGHVKSKNARIVVSNTVKRELGKRFKETGGGKIDLN